MKKIGPIFALAFTFTAGVNAAETQLTHQNSAMLHITSDNAVTACPQAMADMHKKMVPAENKRDDRTVSNTFSNYSEHEKAAVIHESLNNGSSQVHQAQANKHRAMIAADTGHNKAG